MSTQETWRPVEGFENFYEVSSAGFVRSIGKGNWRRKNGILKGSPDSMGYPHVLLHANGRRVTTTVHRLVAKAFIPNPDNLPQINHKNAIKPDNRAENLEWVTCKQNQEHARAHKLQTVPSGTKCWNAKLTEEKVCEMRHRYKTEGVTYKELAAEYGVHHGVVGMIIRREKWKHVADYPG